MKRYTIFLAIVFSFLCLVLSEVRAAETLTWEDCVKEAKEKHPDLISAEEKLNQAKADRTIVTSNILPQISSEISQSTSKTAVKNKTDTYSYGVTVKQLLFDGLKTPYDIAAASKNVKSAQYNHEVTSSDVRLRLRTAFIELLRAQELLNITEDIFRRRKQNIDLVRLRYEGGREHKGSLLTAQADLAQAEFEVAQAKRNIDLAQRQLTKELGRMELKPIRVIGDFEIIDAKRERPNFEVLAASTPFLKALIAEKEAARLGLKSAKAEFFPQVYANMSAGRIDSDWPPDQDEWSVGVTLTFPLFEGGRRWAEVSKARAVLNQVQADERSSRDSVILTLEETWTNLQDTMDTVAVQKKFLRAAEERAKIAQAQYSNGLISFDNWTIIEDDLVRAKKSFLDAQTNTLIAEAEWIQAKGGTLDYGE
ncbi:MAG: TolC family protein [Deltaproteobacteria bacterium]|nr:TolC family protein [Deltaproteobacteria bacterium]